MHYKDLMLLFKDNEVVWGDLGIEPLDLQRGKDTYYGEIIVKMFLKKNGINVKFQIKGESNGKSVFQILYVMLT